MKANTLRMAESKAKEWVLDGITKRLNKYLQPLVSFM